MRRARTSCTRSAGIISTAAAACLLSGCGDSEAERRAAELEHQRALAQIELDTERQRLEMEQELRQRERDEQQRAQREVQLEAQRQAAQRQAQQQDRDRQAVEAVRYEFRTSYIDENTRVLQLHNTKSYSVDFSLRCERRGARQTIRISMPARETVEVGWVEGWDWRSGDQAHAIFDNDVLWTIVAP
ncbi:MAG: hypothetical protein AAF916_11075 [Planctomycetota bacterium]